MFLFQIMIDYVSKAVFLHDRVKRAFKHRLSDTRHLKEETEETALWRDPRYSGASATLGAPNNASAALLSSNLSPNMQNASTLDERLKKMEDLISKVTNPETDERDYDIRMLRIQWRNIAIVLDRCFLVFYSLTIIITTSIIFPKPL